MLIQGFDCFLPRHLFPVKPIFLRRCMIADFGVRLYVSIVAGGSVTNLHYTRNPCAAFALGLSSWVWRDLYTPRPAPPRLNSNVPYEVGLLPPEDEYQVSGDV